MKPRERHEWLRDWIRENGPADVLNRHLVDDYTRSTGCRFSVMPFGANRCAQLGRDLSAMFRLGVLQRHATGIGDGFSSMGFPRWVFSYRLKENSHDGQS